MLKHGTPVRYKVNDFEGKGWVVGISSKLPIANNMLSGYIYIVRSMIGPIPSDDYDYDTFVCPEGHLEVLDEITS